MATMRRMKVTERERALIEWWRRQRDGFEYDARRDLESIYAVYVMRHEDGEAVFTRSGSYARGDDHPDPEEDVLWRRSRLDQMDDQREQWADQWQADAEAIGVAWPFERVLAESSDLTGLSKVEAEDVITAARLRREGGLQ